MNTETGVDSLEPRDAPPLPPPTYLAYPLPSYEPHSGYQRLPDNLDVKYRPRCLQSCVSLFLFFIGVLLLVLSQLPQLAFLEAQCDVNDNKCQTALVNLSPWFLSNYSFAPQYHIWPVPSFEHSSDFVDSVRPDGSSFLDFTCGNRYGETQVLNSASNCAAYISLRAFCGLSVIAAIVGFSMAVEALWGSDKDCRTWTFIVLLISIFSGIAAVILTVVLANKEIIVGNVVNPLSVGEGAKLMGVATGVLFVTWILNVRCKGRKLAPEEVETRSCANCCQCLCGCCTILILVLVLALVAAGSAFLLLAAKGPRPYSYYPTNSNASYQLYVNPSESRLFLSNQPNARVLFSAARTVHGMPGFIPTVDIIPSDPNQTVALKFKLASSPALVRLLDQAVVLGTTFALTWSLSTAKNQAPNTVSVNIQSPTGLLNFRTPIFVLEQTPPREPSLPPPCLAYNLTKNYTGAVSGLNLTINDGASMVNDAVVQLTVTKNKPSGSAAWVTDTQVLSVPNYGAGFYYVGLPHAPAPGDQEWMSACGNNTEFQLNNTCRHLAYLTVQLSNLCWAVNKSLESIRFNSSETLKQEVATVVRACDLVLSALEISCEEFNVSKSGNLHSDQDATILGLSQTLSSADKVDTYSGDVLSLDVSYYREGSKARKSWQTTVNPGTDYPTIILSTDPTAVCNGLSQAGNDQRSTTSIDVGQQSANLTFRYDTYSVPDQMDIYYQGKLLYSSGCVGTNGDRRTDLYYSGVSTSLTVDVIPNCQGTTSTGWDYTLVCAPKIEVKCDCGWLFDCECVCTDGTRVWQPHQGHPPTFDGCGSKTSFFKYVPQEVADKLGFGAGFAKCCNEHDICYGTCGNTNKRACDVSFGVCLLAYCATPFPNLVCVTLANEFTSAVLWFASDAFTTAQKECDCSP